MVQTNSDSANPIEVPAYAGTRDNHAPNLLTAETLPAHPPQTRFTRTRQIEFLRALAECGNVRLACRRTGITPPTAYRMRRTSKELRMGWDAALVHARYLVEDVLADRALNGVEETVFYHGEEVATRRRFDTRLLLAHLARLDALQSDGEVCEIADDFEAALSRYARRDPMHVIPDHAYLYEDEDEIRALCAEEMDDEDADTPD